jgi:hypothetical protein
MRLAYTSCLSGKERLPPSWTLIVTLQFVNHIAAYIVPNCFQVFQRPTNIDRRDVSFVCSQYIHYYPLFVQTAVYTNR